MKEDANDFNNIRVTKKPKKAAAGPKKPAKRKRKEKMEEEEEEEEPDFDEENNDDEVGEKIKRVTAPSKRRKTHPRTAKNKAVSYVDYIPGNDHDD